eukprot:TRINITY_DN3637_c0_g1_i1.p1 TRINITY_DN3637_c0_g1~~TRINITY_DN3637_c0_g1_i1.p1  ORF type:complete len:310 (-),score=40.96 TRINITY_DN3637_c0_g1_i1:16-945(-)
MTAESIMESDKLSFSENFMLSGAAAIVAKCISAPLDRVKLLVQNQSELIKAGRLNAPYQGVMDCTVRVYNEEGLVSFWRGNTANVLRYFPNQALNFAFKDKIQQQFRLTRSDGPWTVFLKNVLSGAVAGAISFSIVYPLDFARTRLASDKISHGSGERQFKGMHDVFRKTMATDGVLGLYRGYTVTCIGVVIYRGWYFGFYDTLKPMLLGPEASLMSSFILGYGVSVTAGLASYPIDTIRRRLMMTSGEVSKYSGSVDCYRQIVRKEGYMALFKGAGINIIRGSTAAGVLAGFDQFQDLYVSWKINGRW